MSFKISHTNFPSVLKIFLVCSCKSKLQEVLLNWQSKLQNVTTRYEIWNNLETKVQEGKPRLEENCKDVYC